MKIEFNDIEVGFLRMALNEAMDGCGDNQARFNRYNDLLEKIDDYHEPFVPFWKQEDDYLESYTDLVYDLERSYNLRDALACGANMTVLDGEEIGWICEDGSYALYKPFEGKTPEELEKIAVEFVDVDKDMDGYTVAKFKRVKE